MTADTLFWYLRIFFVLDWKFITLQFVFRIPISMYSAERSILIKILQLYVSKEEISPVSC
jgi:hypothetical protein